jgi:cephalosporin hydroxylase
MNLVKYQTRKFQSIIDVDDIDYIDGIKLGKTHLKWKGIPLLKDPMMFSIYVQILQDLKPKTILEFGTGSGGSSIFMRDIAQCKVHTFDINAENELEGEDNIFFHHLDLNHISSFVKDNTNLFLNLEHPIFLVEDSHTNIVGTLNEMDKFLIPGDYISVEDTLAEKNYTCLDQFMQKNNNKYLVDTYYCDFWGLNNSWNVNSFLVKV